MGAARPVTSERSSLPKEMEGENEEKSQQRESQGPPASVSPTCMAGVQPKRAVALSIPVESAMCSEAPAKGSSACEGEEAQLFYFWVLHHQSQSRSELCFLIIRNQKWQRRKKQAWHLPRLIPVAGSGPRRQHFSFPFSELKRYYNGKTHWSKGEDAVTGNNVFVPKIPWFSNRERTERMPAQGPDVAPGGIWCPAASALARILP